MSYSNLYMYLIVIVTNLIYYVILCPRIHRTNPMNIDEFVQLEFGTNSLECSFFFQGKKLMHIPQECFSKNDRIFGFPMMSFPQLTTHKAWCLLILRDEKEHFFGCYAGAQAFFCEPYCTSGQEFD